MNFDAVIFDLDGVITKTALVHGAAWKKMFDTYLRSREERFGEPFREFTHADDYLPYVDGKPRYQGVESFLRSRGIDIPFGDPSDPPDAETICGLGNRKNFMFNEVLDEEGVEVYPSSLQLIHELKDHGIKLGVASSSKNCKPVLEKVGILDLFEVRVDGVVSAEIGLKGKPEPDIFTTAADRMGVSYHRSVVVEDAVSGVQAGKKGNFGLVIGVARENNRRELRINGGDIVVEDLGEISLQDIDNWFAEGLAEDNLKLQYFDYDQSKERSREALLTIGNGFWGTRGAMEESRANKVNYPATYFAGLYNRLSSRVGDRDIENEDFVNAINWIPVTFRIEEDPWFAFHPEPNQKILDIERTLSFVSGELSRVITVQDAKGRKTQIVSRRLASMDDPHYGMQTYSVTPLNYSGKVSIRTGLSADHKNAGVERYNQLNQDHLHPLHGEANDNRMILEATTSTSGIRIVAIAQIRQSATSPLRQSAEEEKARVHLQYDYTLKEGEQAGIEKSVAMGVSHHPGFDRISTLVQNGNTELLSAEAIHNTSVEAWRKIREESDIRIAGDRAAQKLVRLHLYHMLITASPHTAKLDVGIPPRGLHGEAYRGHIFWDEIYFFPFYLIHYPEVARATLMYRYRRMDKAKALATEYGYKGAMFPWQSGSDGHEETQVVHLNPVSGEWGPDFSSLQRHISLAIGYNLWTYYHTSGDMKFMEEYGAELLFEICRFWASATRYDPGANRYHIDKVMGPDEFHEKLPGSDEGGLSDNAYTNIMVHWLLDKAIGLSSTLNPEKTKQIFKKAGITKEELANWEHIRSRLNVNISSEGIIEQFQGYFGLKEIDLEVYREKYGNIHRMDRILKAEGKSPDAYKISKQADLMMAFYLLGEEEVTAILKEMEYNVPEDYVERNYRYYLARTSHGSTLSRLVYSTIAYQLGHEETAWPLFMETLKSDLEDIQGGTTGEGIHCGVMGGTLVAVYTVFGGVDLKQDDPGFCPHLPKHWDAMEYRFGFRGNHFSVKVFPGFIQILTEKSIQNEIKAHLCHRNITLTRGEENKIKL